jgi:hypothetical protein
MRCFTKQMRKMRGERKVWGVLGRWGLSGYDGCDRDFDVNERGEFMVNRGN